MEFYSYLRLCAFAGQNKYFTHSIRHRPKKGQLPSKLKSKFDLCLDFHIYTCIWQKNSITWLLDGTEIRKNVKFNSLVYENYFPDEPLHIILNLALGGSFTKNQPNNESLPATMKIDYIKIYQ